MRSHAPPRPRQLPCPPPEREREREREREGDGGGGGSRAGRRGQAVRRFPSLHYLLVSAADPTTHRPRRVASRLLRSWPVSSTIAAAAAPSPHVTANERTTAS